MCGILALLFGGVIPNPDLFRAITLQQVKTIRHRGPDWSGMYVGDRAILAHERLGLVGLDNGEQPIYSADRKLVLAVNGEIYNHRQLRSAIESAPTPFFYDFQTASDCEIISALYAKAVSEAKGGAIDLSWVDKLEGMFAFVLWDVERQQAVVARDHLGIIPLYFAFTRYVIDGTPVDTLQFASEMKALLPPTTYSSAEDVSGPNCLAAFPPGRIMALQGDAAIKSLIDKGIAEGRSVQELSSLLPLQHYYRRDWQRTVPTPAPADREETKSKLHDALCDAVKSHMMCDTPYGVLLSGGLDSSIISALAKLYSERRVETDGAEQAWWPRLHSFAIGLPGSPDLEAAAIVAKHIGSVHHSFTFSVQEGLDALPDVIHHVETYDTTTIRASTPMYLLARKIKALGVKMVLSGEGSDEVFGGYLYFHKAPSAHALHEETVRKLDRLHLYDCLRANKSMAAWGVEARVPFLDKTFLDAAMSIDPAVKLIQQGKSIEKQILREAFAKYLPESVAWRQKEQFGDGVGYSWIDSVKAHAAATVSDDDFSTAATRFPVNTPDTKEAFLYRTLFDRYFGPSQTSMASSCAATVPQGGKSVACSTAEALEWDAAFKARAADPSGRSIAGVHTSASS